MTNRRPASLGVALSVALATMLAVGCTLGTSDASGPAAPVATRPTTSTVSAERVPAERPDEADPVTVVEVIDGDTFVALQGGTEERVRLIGIDTPETGDCLYEEAKQALEAQLASGDVFLSIDSTDRDRFDRLLRYVWVGDLLINEVQVGNGFAVARRYPPDVAQAERLEAAEQAARSAALGRWAPTACGELATNVDGSASLLRIDHLEFDAPGDDSVALNGEWVHIVNDGEASVQLEGWQLRDDSVAHRFTFPRFELAPGAAVTIYSGCGVGSSDELYWCTTRSAIWNNDGDTAYLIDPAGNTITSYGY